MDKDILKDAQEAFKQCQDNESDNRVAALDDLKFARLGEQWPQEIKRQRQLEGRPCLTINRLPTFIRQVVNDSRMNKPAIRVHPATSGADQKTAEIYQGLIRQIEVTSNADVAYDTAIDFAVTCGFGYFRINAEYYSHKTFDLDLCIERIANPFTVYGDPKSTCADSSDWDTAFVTEMLSEQEFKQQYPNAKKSNFEGSDDIQADWYSDGDVRVAEYWTRSDVKGTILKMSDGSILDEESFLKLQEILMVQGIRVEGTREVLKKKVKQHVISGLEVLKTIDWQGCYIPIIPVYGDEVNVEGKRHFLSLIRFAKDPQQMYNYWRSASTELVALAPKTPFIGPRGAFDSDSEKWATANVKSHAYIEYDGQIPPQRQPFAGPPAGAIQEAMSASDDMKNVMGLFDASLGAKSNETSGRAILARQREGDVSTFHFIDNMSRAIRHAGRVLVDLIPKVYDTPRMVRILSEEGKTMSVGVNGLQDYDEVYDLTVGEYDVTVDSGPSFSTRREEAAFQMNELMKNNPNVTPLIADLFARNLDWPGAEEVAKRLKAMLPPQILEMEKTNLPPEAQVAMQGMSQQLQQLQAQIQQGAQAYEQIRKEYDLLKVQNANKQAEIMAGLKEAEIDRDTKLQLAQMNNAADEREILLKGMLERQQTQMEQKFEQFQLMISQFMNAVSQPPNVTINNGKPSRKKMQIVAPSGAIYEGMVEDEVENEAKED